MKLLLSVRNSLTSSIMCVDTPVILIWWPGLRNLLLRRYLGSQWIILENSYKITHEVTHCSCYGELTDLFRMERQCVVLAWKWVRWKVSLTLWHKVFSAPACIFRRLNDAVCYSEWRNSLWPLWKIQRVSITTQTSPTDLVEDTEAFVSLFIYPWGASKSTKFVLSS